MDKVIEFKNFEQIDNLVSLDFYTNSRFIVKLTDSIFNIMNSSDTEVTLYEYFRKAALICIDQQKESLLTPVTLLNTNEDKHVIH